MVENGRCTKCHAESHTSSHVDGDDLKVGMLQLHLYCDLFLLLD